MRALFDKIWNFDFYTSNRLKISSVLLAFVTIIIAVAYPLAEVLLAVGNASSSINIFKYLETLKAGNRFSFTYPNFEQAFPHIWISLALLCVVVRIISIIHSYHLSKKELGRASFEKLFLAGTAAFLVGALSGAFILALMSGLSQSAGIGVQWEGNPFLYIVDRISSLVKTHVPSVLNIQHYGAAFVLTIFLRGLPGYFIH